MKRFPVIDELINNAGSLTTGTRLTTVDGVDMNFAVNVITPLLLTRTLVPALKAAVPTGKAQITSDGMVTDDLDASDPESNKKAIGLPAYSHSKRVTEVMTIALSQELSPQDIVVNVVGGAAFGVTSMTKAVSFSDMPWFMKLFCPCIKFMTGDDGGKSAKACATPCVLAVEATAQDIGTGKSYMAYTKERKFGKAVAKPENQVTVMQYISSKLV